MYRNAAANSRDPLPRPIGLDTPANQAARVSRNYLSHLLKFLLPLAAPTLAATASPLMSAAFCEAHCVVKEDARDNASARRQTVKKCDMDSAQRFESSSHATAIDCTHARKFSFCHSN